MEWMLDPQAWIALATLTALEIILGIDNIIFISVLVSRLPMVQRNRARTLGIGLAMISRLGLLFSLAWIMGMTSPLFTLFANEISLRDLILIVGGLFLLWKSTHEIHNSLEDVEETAHTNVAAASFTGVLIQIALIDAIFSLDSVITAVGMSEHLQVMVIAIVLAVIVMILAARLIGEFVDNHPTIKMLALSFLILIGVTLLAEGLEFHIPKGYIYFAMAFSVAVETLNIKMRSKLTKPVKLRKKFSYVPPTKVTE